MTVSPVDIADRCPIGLAVGSINTPGSRADFLLDIGIFGDLRAALRSDLQISHFSAPLSLPLEEPLECGKPLRYPFRAIQSIDPNDERTTAEALNNALNQWGSH